MTAETMKTLKPGDRVRIVKYPPKGSAFVITTGDPRKTEMGEYLGKTMTIKKVHERCCTMKEDGGRWAWTPSLIEKLIIGGKQNDTTI